MTVELQKTSSAASTAAAGRSTDDAQGRGFPCERCGGNLTFHRGPQSLPCPFCDHVQEIQIDTNATIVEQDHTATLEQLVNQNNGQDDGLPRSLIWWGRWHWRRGLFHE